MGCFGSAGACRTAVLATFAVASGCSSAPPLAPGELHIGETHFLGEIWAAPMARSRVLFQDGSNPILAPGGALWVFGDTFLGDNNPPGSLTPPTKDIKPHYDGAASATIGWVNTRRPGEAAFPPAISYYTDTKGTATSPFSPLTDEERDKIRLWPLGGVSVGSKTYLYYAMIQATDGPGPWNFKGVGGGLAVADKPLGPFTRLTPNDSANFPVQPSHAMTVGEWIYFYEVRGEDPGRGLRLARVRATEIENPQAYEFCTGIDPNTTPAWSREARDIAVLARDVQGQFSLEWNETLHAYLAATSSDFFHPREIGLRTSPTPWGPWSSPVRIPVPDRKDGKVTKLIYCTSFHPELEPVEGHQIVLTFCRMLDGEWDFSNPEMVTVDLLAH